MRFLRLWEVLFAAALASFAVLGYCGDGQNVWQSMGSRKAGAAWAQAAHYIVADWPAERRGREAKEQGPHEGSAASKRTVIVLTLRSETDCTSWERNVSVPTVACRNSRTRPAWRLLS